MAKEYSVGYKFKGDASGFKRTMSDMNRSVGSINRSFSGLAGSLAKVGMTIAATFALGIISKFTKGAITAALKTEDLSRQGLETAASMSRITQSIEDIKSSIGKVIVESKFWHFWTTRLENTLTKVKGLFKDTEGLQVKGFTKESINNQLQSIKDLGESLLKSDINYLVSKIKEGAIESQNMAKAWAVIHKEIGGAAIPLAETEQLMPSGANGRLSANFQVPATEGLRGAPAQVEELTDSLEDQMWVVNELTGTFQNMFSSIDEGVDGMIESLINSIKRLAIELIAKAATFALIWALFPGMGINLSGGGGFMTGLKSFTGLGSISPSVSGLGNTGSKPISVVGKLSGRDIYLSSSRYGNMLAGNT